MLKFTSFSSDLETQTFETNYEITKTGYISFVDKSALDTKIYIKEIDNSFIIKRLGNISMQMTLQEGKTTKAIYKDINGVSMEFETKCLSFKSAPNQFDVVYELILDKNVISTHKLNILFE